MDRMQATPRSAFFGGLADFLAAGTSPQRTQQMRGLMEFLQVPDIAATLDRVSYGEPLTTGRGMTTKLRPETESTLMAALGMTPVGKPAQAGAMALGRAGERVAERVVPQVMERGGLPAEMLSAMAQGTQSPATAGKTARALGNLPVKPSTDDAGQVMDATFRYGALGGKKTMPIDMLSGGVRISDPKEAERVRKLAEQMSGPEGYISRLIVDDAGNVLEGQHRLEALQMLGQKNVPVTVVKDLGRKYNTEAMEQALAGSMRSEQVKQMVQNAIEALEDSGSIEGALAEYSMPPRLQKQFESVLRASQRNIGDQGLLGNIGR